MAVAEEDSGGFYKICPFCGFRHFQVFDLAFLGSRTPLFLDEVTFFNYPIEQEEYENNECDEVLDNGIPRVKKQRKILKNGWKEEAYMFRPAKKKLDEIINEYVYLDKIRNEATKLNERLKVQLMKLNERFKEIAVPLNDSPLISEGSVENNDEEARKIMKRNKHFEMFGSGVYCFEWQNLINNADVLTWQDRLNNVILSTHKKVQLQIFAITEEQESVKSLSSRRYNVCDDEKTPDLTDLTEVHMDSSDVEHRKALDVDELPNYSLIDNSLKDSSVAEEQSFDDDKYHFDQIETTEEDKKFLDLSANKTEITLVLDVSEAEYGEENYRPGMLDIQSEPENEENHVQGNTDLTDKDFGERRTEEKMTQSNDFEEQAREGERYSKYCQLFYCRDYVSTTQRSETREVLLDNINLSPVFMQVTDNLVASESQQTEIVVGQSSGTEATQSKEECVSDSYSTTAALSETFLKRKQLYTKSQLNERHWRCNSSPVRNCMKLFENLIFKTLLLVILVSAVTVECADTGNMKLTHSPLLKESWLLEQNIHHGIAVFKSLMWHIKLDIDVMLSMRTKMSETGSFLDVTTAPGRKLKGDVIIIVSTVQKSRRSDNVPVVGLHLLVNGITKVAKEEQEKDVTPVQLKEEYTYENKFHCVSRSSTDKHYCPPKNQHKEGNNRRKAIIDGLIIYAVAIFVALRGMIKHDGSFLLFSLMVSGLSFCFFLGLPVTALLCQLKPILWIFMKMINILNCILFVLKIFDQRYLWMEYICAFKCYLKEYLRKSSLDEVLSEPIEEVSCSKIKKHFSNGEENTEIQRYDCDEDNVEVIDLDLTEKLSKNVFIRAEEELQAKKKIENEDPMMEEIDSNKENNHNIFDINTSFTEIRPVGFKPFDTFEDEDVELQENDIDTDIITEEEIIQKKDFFWYGNTDNNREKDENRDDQGLQQAYAHCTTSGSNDNPKVHFIADYDENEKNLQVLIPPVDQTLGSSQPLPDSNDNVNDAVGFGEDNFRNEKLKLKLQVVPNPSPSFCAQTNVKAVDQQTKPKKMEECRNDSFFNLKYTVKEEKPKRRELYLRCTEDCFEMCQKAPGKLRDIVSYDTVRRYTWLRDLPIPKIDITLAYLPAVETNVESHAPRFEPLLSIIDQIANGTPPTPHVSMRYELLRFCTLRSYPKENKPYLIKLAEAGFYYASDGDGVVCYCCGVRRYNWVAEDVPMKIHQRINPNCKFLRKNEEVNVPVKYYGPFSKSLMAIMDIPEPRERAEQGEDVNNDWAPERVRSPAPAQQNRTNETGANSLGINTAVPKHTQYATKTAREGSYSGWPDTASHTPQELSEAGFFYAGFGDCVRCFYCGIGLRHWTKDDNPWIEHARWSRNCVFVKQKKGEEFVNLVQLAVQYSQDNEAQSNTSEAGNQLPAQEIERILLSDAAQSVLEMGYQPRIIKKAIEQILRQSADTKITAEILMEKVLEIEEAENPAQAAPAPPKAKPAPQTAKPEVSKPVEGAQAAAVSKTEEKPEGDKTSVEGKDKDKESKDLSAEAASQDPKAIKAENEQLKEQTLCKVCLDNTVCIVFLPCGHLVTCADCAPAMRKCPICRALVKGTVRTYMS